MTSSDVEGLARLVAIQLLKQVPDVCERLLYRYALQIARLLDLAHHLRVRFSYRRMYGREKIGVLGFPRDFVMPPGHYHFRLIRIVLVFQNHTGLSFSVRRIQQLPDPGELGLQFLGLRRSEADVASSVCNFHFGLVPDPALMRGRNLQVFAVLGHSTAGHLNALVLKPRGDLIVRQRTLGILILNHLLDLALQQ